MIDCSNFSENVCAYIDNELSMEERLSFDEHVRNCAQCRRELDEMVRIVNLCAELPMCELPADFGAELHERLIAVAGRLDKHCVKDINRAEKITDTDDAKSRQTDKPGRVAGAKRTKSYLLLRTVAAVAAGLLLIFLAGSFYKYGVLSPIKMQSRTDMATSIATATEKPKAAKGMETAAGEAAYAGKVGGTYAVPAGTGSEENTSAEAKVLTALPTDTAAEAAPATIDRSAAVQNREAVAAEKNAASETAESRMSEITIYNDNPDAQVDAVKQLAFEIGGEIADKQMGLYTADTSADQSNRTDLNGVMAAAASETDIPKQLQLNFIVPYSQYNQFILKLNEKFGAANVAAGALISQDVTESLNSSISESERLDNRIRELQKEDSAKNEAEISRLKAQKELSDKRIDELRVGNDFVRVAVHISGK